MTSLSSARPVMQWNERGVSMALWKREHDGATFYDISITRSYKKDQRAHLRRNIRLCVTPCPTISCIAIKKRVNIANLI